jgi:multiple sugar transport system permease protein
MYLEIEAPESPVGLDRVEAVRPSLGRRVLSGLAPYLYLAPALGLLVLWTYRPLAQAVNLSFFDWNLLPTSPMHPVGMENYRRVFEAPELRQAVGNTLFYIAGLLPFSVLIPVAVALVTRGVGGGARTAYRSIVFLPMLVTPIATATLWRWLLDPSGLLNQITRDLGLGTHNWLREEATALPSMVAITAWQILGFAVLVVSAGLAAINPDYAEAAAIDGASRWHITRRITLPLLSPTLLFMVLMTVLLSAQWTFPLIDVLTQGGPTGSTTNVYYLLWQYGFRTYNAGLSAAAGLLFFLVFGLIAVGLVWLSDRLSFHDN